MSETIAPPKTTLNWAVEIPPEIAKVMGVAEGSVAMLRATDGKLEVEEILPPPSPELKERVQQIFEKYKEAFEEMKRLGD
jgi:hypothetical protein